LVVLHLEKFVWEGLKPSRLASTKSAFPSFKKTSCTSSLFVIYYLTTDTTLGERNDEIIMSAGKSQ
jgi:hypothetical protein